VKKRIALLVLPILSGFILPFDASLAGEEPPKNPDFSRVTAAVDVNGDGLMMREEWTAAGLPTSSFDMFEAGRGFVTQDDYDTNAAPSGIDGDGDGFLTVEEFIEFDRKMSAGGPPGTPPPGGPPPTATTPELTK